MRSSCLWLRHGLDIAVIFIGMLIDCCLTLHCDTKEYYNSSKGQCVPCTHCQDPLVVIKPCYVFQDVVCASPSQLFSSGLEDSGRNLDSSVKLLEPWNDIHLPSGKGDHIADHSRGTLDTSKEQSSEMPGTAASPKRNGGKRHSHKKKKRRKCLLHHGRKQGGKRRCPEDAVSATGVNLHNKDSQYNESSKIPMESSNGTVVWKPKWLNIKRLYEIYLLCAITASVFSVVILSIFILSHCRSFCEKKTNRRRRGSQNASAENNLYVETWIGPPTPVLSRSVHSTSPSPVPSNRHLTAMQQSPNPIPLRSYRATHS